MNLVDVYGKGLKLHILAPYTIADYFETFNASTGDWFDHTYWVHERGEYAFACVRCGGKIIYDNDRAWYCTKCNRRAFLLPISLDQERRNKRNNELQ